MKREIEIPSELEAKVEGNKVTISKNGEELKEEFKLGKVEIEKTNGKIEVKIENPKKKEKSLVGTITGRINNMIKGLTEGYEYKLRLVYQHFPVKLNVKGDKLEINNFAGEKKPRHANIVGDTDVQVKGEEIIVKGKSKDDAGQTAANFEQATWLRKKDPRVFEDGIYIEKKPGD